MPTTIASTTLPITGKLMPAEPLYHVTGIKTHVGREGGGYNATIRVGTKQVGLGIDEGNGGPAFFQANTLELDREWRAYCDAAKALREAADPDTTIWMIDEDLVNDLVTEYELAKQFKKPNRTFYVTEAHDLAWGECGYLTGGGPSEATVAYLRAHPEIGAVRYWDGSAWQLVAAS